MNKILFSTIVTTADYMARWNIYPSDEADEWITQALKTEGYYYRVLWRAVRDAYDGLLTSFEFETIFLTQISSQFRRGFNSGLRAMGLSPTDMLPEWEAELQDLMAQELTYVQKLMDDILASARSGGGYAQLKNRIEMWANRFNEMESLGMLRAGELVPTMMSWVLGPTEHCPDCLGYSQMGPQPASFWRSVEISTGHRPQSRALACNGYNCQCGYAREERREVNMLFAPALNR